MEVGSGFTSSAQALVALIIAGSENNFNLLIKLEMEVLEATEMIRKLTEP